MDNNTGNEYAQLPAERSSRPPNHFLGNISRGGYVSSNEIPTAIAYDQSFPSFENTAAPFTGNPVYQHEYTRSFVDYRSVDNSEYSDAYEEMPVMYHQHSPQAGTSAEVSSEDAFNYSHGIQTVSRRENTGPTTRGRGRRKAQGNTRKGTTRTFEALSSGPLPISLTTPSSSFIPTGDGEVEVITRPPGGWFWALLSTKDQEIDATDEISESTSLEDIPSDEVDHDVTMESKGYASENPLEEPNQHANQEKDLERANRHENSVEQEDMEQQSKLQSVAHPDENGSNSDGGDDDGGDNPRAGEHEAQFVTISENEDTEHIQSDMSMYDVSDDDSEYRESPIAGQSPQPLDVPRKPLSRASRRQRRRRRLHNRATPTSPITIPIQLTQPPLCNVTPAYPQALDADPVPRTRKQSKYTPEQDQLILEMKNNGSTWAEIASRARCHNQLAARNRYQVLIGQQGGGTYSWDNKDCAQLQVMLDEGEREKWFFIAEELSRKFERKFTFEAVFYQVCKMFAKRPERFGILKTKDSTKGAPPLRRRELFDREKEDREQEERLRALREAMSERTYSPRPAFVHHRSPASETEQSKDTEQENPTEGEALARTASNDGTPPEPTNAPNAPKSTSKT